MKKEILLDFNKNRTRKTKRRLSWLSFCMMLLMGQMSFAQCVPPDPTGGCETQLTAVRIDYPNPYSINDTGLTCTPYYEDRILV